MKYIFGEAARAEHLVKVRVPGFPLDVLYRIADAEVEVLVIAHHRRRPGYWQKG